MDKESLAKLLEQVRRGDLTVAEAVEKVRIVPFADLEFAKVDHHRQVRCGFPEVIYGEGKTPEQLARIFASVVEHGGRCLATRVNESQAAHVHALFPGAEHEPVGRTLWYGEIDDAPRGQVLVLTAGTSDLPVAKEAETTVRVMGTKVDVIADVGVAGLHRLLGHRHRLTSADAIVVVAGMEGALPSVVGGLVDCPVVAVPTSVGYGANLQGFTALFGMLSSCAANVCVVNIDGGFCGGYVAALIARRAAAPLQPSTHEAWP